MKQQPASAKVTPAPGSTDAERRPLNSQQDRFVVEYLKSHSGKASAIAAGYSPKTAAVKASQLLKHREIRRALGLSEIPVVNSPARVNQLTPEPARSSKGRPPMEPTAEITDRVYESVSRGLFLTQAARLAGVSTDTIARWKKKGAEGIEPFRTFFERLEEAELRGEEALLRIWRDAAPADWRAAREMLAKRFPERWSDHAGRLAVLGRDGDGTNRGPIFNIHIHLEADECEQHWKEQARLRRLAPAAPAIDVTPPANESDPDPSLN